MLVLYIFIFFKRKIEEVIVGPVNMWITENNQSKTVYPHVDRLCVTTKKLCTVFTLLELVQFKSENPTRDYPFNCVLISLICF